MPAVYDTARFAFAVVLGVFVSNTVGTQDVNLAMYMYLANHLTPQQCLKLVARLYADGLESSAVKELGKYNRHRATYDYSRATIFLIRNRTVR